MATEETQRRSGTGGQVGLWLVNICYAAKADQGDSLCLESKAWLLLGILLNRVPTTVAARLLNMYKITAVFERTVHLIKNHIEFEEIDRARSVSRDSENGSLIADSSSATIDFPSRVIEKASKKRKRDRTIQTPSKSSGELGFNAIQLLLCICGAIQQMQGLTVTVMGGAEDFATEHMKAVLKTTQEQAAKVLGGSLMLTCQTLETLGRGWDALKNAGIYTRLLSPVIGLWECRAAAGGNTTGEMSSVSHFGASVGFGIERAIASLFCGVPRADRAAFAFFPGTFWHHT